MTLICLIKKINIRTQRAQKNASSKSIIKIPVKKKRVSNTCFKNPEKE